MQLATMAIILAAGFVIMTPIGPVSTICIRRSLIYGPRAGIVAGAGDAVAVAAYATIGVMGSTLLTRFFAPFATLWHVGIAVVLVAVAILIWRSRPTLPKVATQTRSNLLNGFVATLALALANPADIILFATLFAGLGVVIHTPLQCAIFCVAIFLGGCAYWVALSLILDRWRAGMTTARMVLLNRTCSSLMIVAAAASLVSLARTAA